MLLRVVECTVYDHDVKLVVLAAALCAFACYTAIHMLSRVDAVNGRMRPMWIAAAGLAFGTGVWTTHFVALLAFRAGVPVSLAPDITLASLALAICLSFASFAFLLETHSTPLTTVTAAILLTAGIGGMHYIGVTAMVLPGVLHFGANGVAASIAAGLLLSLASLAAFRRGHLPGAAILLCLAVCGLHFTGMTALHVEAAAVNAGSATLPAGVLALALAAAGLLVLALSLTGSMLDQRLAGRAAQETSRWRQFADATFEGILFETDGVITDANTALGALLGRPPETMSGQDLEAVFDAATAQRLRSPARDVAPEAVEGELRCSDGSTKTVEVLRRPIAGPGRRVVLAVRDISDRRAAEQQIEHLAYHDPLTGLPNRLIFHGRLAQAIAMADRTGQGLAVLALDLDGFSATNDLLGYPVGDRLLVQVAGRIAATVRGTDTAARIGGDEFAVVQPLASQPDLAAALAKRLLADLCRPYEIEGRLVRLGVSIGIALHPGDGATADALARNADCALGRAKQDGRGVFRFFEPEMDRELRKRRTLGLDLREALGRDELALHYQPLFDGQTLGLCGYEALLRWTHPLRGSVSPSQFIPIAEECGLIDGIGRWTLEQACAAAVRWPDHLRIAVNLSPVQFRQTDLVGMIAATLHRHGLAPARLELEITEGVLIDDADRALAILRQLKALGVRIALDDFGTGYSSLSYLRRFPFDKLKIDKSFVQGLGEDADADAIVRSIIAMAQSLRLDVTAEGVETEGQLARLRAECCSQVQGFLLGRPCAVPDYACIGIGGVQALATALA